MNIFPELELGGHRMNRIGGADLCTLLAISPAALSDLKKRGIAVWLGHDVYDLEATVTAYVTHLRGVASGRGGEDHVATLTEERARLAKEQADAVALKNAALRDELVKAADVRREWGGILRKVRDRVLAVPDRLRSSLPQLDTAGINTIDRELRTALEDLAHADD